MHFWLYLHLRRLYGAAMGTQMTVAFVMDRQRSVVDVVCYCCGDLNGRVFQPVTLVTRVADHLFIKIIGSVWFQFHYSNDKANSSNFSHLITCIIEWHLLLNWYLFRRNFGKKKMRKKWRHLFYLGNMMVGLMMRVVLYVIADPQYNHDYKVQTVDFVLVNCESQGVVFDAV